MKVGEEKEYTYGLKLSPFICINYKGRKVALQRKNLTNIILTKRSNSVSPKMEQTDTMCPDMIDGKDTTSSILNFCQNI